MREVKGSVEPPEGMEPRAGKAINIVVVTAHLPPGGLYWKGTIYDRPAQTETGVVVGIWTNRDFYGEPWFWVAKSDVSGLYYKIHPMETSWIKMRQDPEVQKLIDEVSAIPMDLQSEFDDSNGGK